VKITIAAIGRLKAGPERELFERFIGRATATGRNLGLTMNLREFPESRAATAALRREQESTALLGTLPPRGILVALDENGRALASPALAEHIARWRDSGTEDLVFAIGGADGQGQSVLARAGLKLAFGAMTWPHQLVRVMLAEQLYRATTILAGHPYHRD
jgi:23S rRNA (pseudouridine1915-N3)-methyltransferase